MDAVSSAELARLPSAALARTDFPRCERVAATLGPAALRQTVSRFFLLFPCELCNGTSNHSTAAQLKAKLSSDLAPSVTLRHDHPGTVSWT